MGLFLGGILRQQPLSLWALLIACELVGPPPFVGGHGVLLGADSLVRGQLLEEM